jgi:hypothetical protein
VLTTARADAVPTLVPTPVPTPAAPSAPAAAPAGAPAVILAGPAMPPAAATDATAPDADADARVAAAPDAAARAAAPTAPAAESTATPAGVPAAPGAAPAGEPASGPTVLAVPPAADEPATATGAAHPNMPDADAEAPVVPASVEKCATALRAIMGPDHPFSLSYAPSTEPKHHNTIVQCDLPDCADKPWRPGGGGMEKTKPSLINFARAHCGFGKLKGFHSSWGCSVHRAGAARRAAARGAVGTTTAADDTTTAASETETSPEPQPPEPTLREATTAVSGSSSEAAPGPSGTSAVTAKPDKTRRAAANAVVFAGQKSNNAAWTDGFALVIHDGRHHIVCEYCNGDTILTMHHHTYQGCCRQHRGTCPTQKPLPKRTSQLTSFFSRRNSL